MTIDWRNYDAFGKASRYGGHLRHRHDGGLDHKTALHWVLHHRHGAALPDRLGLPPDEVADLLVRAAAMHPTNKQDTNMSDTQSFTKAVADLGEHGYTKIIQKYASANRLPSETASQAFTRIFTEDSAQGAAIRKFWQVSKQGPLDDDEAEDEAEGVEDDALEELKELARQLRVRCPQLTKAQAFTKIYTDPENAKLAARERRANRPRA
jgi:hypothetical protein